MDEGTSSVDGGAMTEGEGILIVSNWSLDFKGLFDSSSYALSVGTVESLISR